MIDPQYFATPEDFRQWLEANHQQASELLVGFHKKQTGLPSLTWEESVKEALCFGWIDGVRKSLGDTAYTIRFTPRKAGSIWSAVNIKHVADLTAQGRMHPAGLKAFAARKTEKSGIYSHEQAAAQLDPVSQARLQANHLAWAFFQKKAPSYQKACRHWVMGAKQETTKERRLTKLIEDSAQGKMLTQFTPRLRAK